MAKEEDIKILLVEDELQLVGMYQKRFEMEGFDVAVAEDGLKAITMVQAFDPDIVLLDIMMPKVDGIEVLRRMRENEETKDTLVIVLTNLSSESTAEKIYKYGATEYIVKADMTPLQVVEKVREVLNIYNK